MKQFNKDLKNIRKRVEVFLDFKKETGMLENDRGQKFWRGKLLVGIETWNHMMGRSKLDIMLKHMPKGLVNHPLPPIFDSSELLLYKYKDWLSDYFAYLVEICHEQQEGLLDKITKW